MSCGIRIFAGFSALALVAALAAQDKSTPEPSPKERFLHPRQLPYHLPDTGKDDAQSKTGQTGGKIGKKSGGKSGGKGTQSQGKTGTDKQPVEADLGLRYLIVKCVGNDKVEVSPDAEFHNGDKIQIRVETTAPGYLYILNRAPSGDWPAMFPSQDFQGGDNRVEARHKYDFPPRCMEFYDPKGVERLTILFARQPEPDFENVIRSRRPDDKKSDSLARAVAIGADLVRKKQDMYSRDLRIEKAPPTPPGAPKDNATYAVNSTGNPDSRVFLEIPLVHQ